MPHAVFFDEGYAIHGTIHVTNFGRRASKGCVRLHPANAATLFSLVQKNGMKNTKIVVEQGAIASVEKKRRKPRRPSRRRPVECNPAKWKPVRRKIARQIKELNLQTSITISPVMPCSACVRPVRLDPALQIGDAAGGDRHEPPFRAVARDRPRSRGSRP